VYHIIDYSLLGMLQPKTDDKVIAWRGYVGIYECGSLS